MGISKIAYELKLPYIRKNIKLLIDEANHTKMSYLDFLTAILEREFILRRENSIKTRLRAAKFPLKKYL